MILTPKQLEMLEHLALQPAPVTLNIAGRRRAPRRKVLNNLVRLGLIGKSVSFYVISDRGHAELDRRTPRLLSGLRERGR